MADVQCLTCMAWNDAPHEPGCFDAKRIVEKRIVEGGRTVNAARRAAGMPEAQAVRQMTPDEIRTEELKDLLVWLREQERSSFERKIVSRLNEIGGERQHDDESLADHLRSVHNTPFLPATPQARRVLHGRIHQEDDEQAEQSGTEPPRPSSQISEEGVRAATKPSPDDLARADELTNLLAWIEKGGHTIIGIRMAILNRIGELGGLGENLQQKLSAEPPAYERRVREMEMAGVLSPDDETEYMKSSTVEDPQVAIRETLEQVRSILSGVESHDAIEHSIQLLATGVLPAAKANQLAEVVAVHLRTKI